MERRSATMFTNIWRVEDDVNTPTEKDREVLWRLRDSGYWGFYNAYIGEWIVSETFDDYMFDRGEKFDTAEEAIAYAEAHPIDQRRK